MTDKIPAKKKQATLSDEEKLARVEARKLKTLERQEARYAQQREHKEVENFISMSSVLTSLSDSFIEEAIMRLMKYVVSPDARTQVANLARKITMDSTRELPKNWILLEKLDR